jgi:hypothetical protein
MCLRYLFCGASSLGRRDALGSSDWLLIPPLFSYSSGFWFLFFWFDPFPAFRFWSFFWFCSYLWITLPSFLFSCIGLRSGSC